jgi:hypothetical protein
MEEYSGIRRARRNLCWTFKEEKDVRMYFAERALGATSTEIAARSTECPKLSPKIPATIRPNLRDHKEQRRHD